MSYQRNPRKLKKVSENADGNLQDKQREEDETVPIQQDGDGTSEKDGN
jgi:hypothetical protein